MRTKIYLFILALTICTSNLTIACTIFNATKDNTTLVGNNEDWLKRNSYIKFLPANEQTYGTMYFGFGKGCKYTFGGVNDQGLFYDIASLTRRTDIIFDPNKKTLDNPIYERMLEKCSSVDQAIEFLGKYNISGFRRHHIMVVDKTGASAILEWGRDSLSVIRKQGYYQVITNFNVTDPNLAGWYPCWRYSKADTALKNMNELSVDLFRTILDDVHMEGRFETVYSNIYDLKNNIIYVYHFHNFEEYIKIDITDELKKGRHSYYLPSLFSNVKLLSPSQAEEVNTTSVEFVWKGTTDNYKLFCSSDPNFTQCEPIRAVASNNKPTYSAYITLVLVSTFTALGLYKSKNFEFLITFALLIAFMLVSCEKKPVRSSLKTIRKTVENLQNNTTYYWKVAAMKTESISSETMIRSFNIRTQRL